VRVVALYSRCENDCSWWHTLNELALTADELYSSLAFFLRSVPRVQFFTVEGDSFAGHSGADGSRFFDVLSPTIGTLPSAAYVLSDVSQLTARFRASVVQGTDGSLLSP